MFSGGDFPCITKDGDIWACASCSDALNYCQDDYDDDFDGAGVRSCVEAYRPDCIAELDRVLCGNGATAPECQGVQNTIRREATPERSWFGNVLNWLGFSE